MPPAGSFFKEGVYYELIPNPKPQKVAKKKSIRMRIKHKLWWNKWKTHTFYIGKRLHVWFICECWDTHWVEDIDTFINSLLISNK